MTRAVVSKGGEAGWRVRRQATLSDVDRSGSSCGEEPWDGWISRASRGRAPEGKSIAPVSGK